MGGITLQEVTAILFDLDNTLIDTKRADRLGCEQVYRMLHTYEVKKQWARQAVEKYYQSLRERPNDPQDVTKTSDIDSWRTMLWKQALGPKLVTFASSAYKIWREERMKHIKFTPDIIDLLEELRRHYKLGLVTNGASSAQWEKIYHLQCQLYFDTIVVSGDLPKGKPHPSIFEEVFRRLDVSSLECLMVGDKLETDIKGGIKSNCAATVWVSSDIDSLDGVQPKPDFKIGEVKELKDLLPKKSLFSSLHNAQALGFYHKLHEEQPTWRKKLQW